MLKTVSNFLWWYLNSLAVLIFFLKNHCLFFCFIARRLQRGKKHQIENGSGAEDNGDSSHCSNASVHSNQEAGPSIKRTKTSDDSGLDMDNATENGGGDMALDGASEIELVFRPHPTLMEKEDAAQTRWVISNDWLATLWLHLHVFVSSCLGRCVFWILIYYQVHQDFRERHSGSPFQISGRQTGSWGTAQERRSKPN